MTTATTKNTIEKIIKNHVLDEIFCEYPTDKDAFEFFLEADVNCAEDVSMSPLGEEYEVCQAYELDNIHSIRGLMQSKKCDLERLINKVSEAQKESSLNDEIEFHEERADRTLHGLRSGLAYYNYEGTHYRVFASFEDGLAWLDTNDSSLVIAEFDDEEELDNFFGKK